jgi:hypothetical protein
MYNGLVTISQGEDSMPEPSLRDRIRANTARMAAMEDSDQEAFAASAYYPLMVVELERLWEMEDARRNANCINPAQLSFAPAKAYEVVRDGKIRTIWLARVSTPNRTTPVAWGHDANGKTLEFASADQANEYTRARLTGIAIELAAKQHKEEDDAESTDR